MDAWKEETAGGVGSMRVGIVKHLYPNECAVEVHLPDVDDGEFVTFKLPVLQHGAGNKARAWWMPALNDQVLVCFLPYAPDFGFVLGSFYAPSDSMPTSSATDFSITFDNGDYLAYKASQRTFEAKVKQTHVKVSDGLVEAGNGSEKYVALAPDVKTQLDAIKLQFDAIATAFNAHTHICNAPTLPSGNPTASTPPTTIVNSYVVGNVAASHVKAD